MMLAFASWDGRPADRFELQRRLRTRLAPRSDDPWSARLHAELLLVDITGPRALAAALDVACRHDAWACVVMLRPPGQPGLQALHWMGRARRSPWGLAVRADPTDPRVDAVGGALALFVGLLRVRRAAAWVALDAARVHGGDATAAARSLGISPQAVSKHLRRNHARATDLMPQTLSRLLKPNEDGA